MANPFPFFFIRPLNNLNIIPPLKVLGQFCISTFPEFPFFSRLLNTCGKKAFRLIYRHGATSLPEVKFGYLLARVLFLDISLPLLLLCDIIQCLFVDGNSNFISDPRRNKLSQGENF